MNELICANCNTHSPESTPYCQQCGQPLLCKNCRVPLSSKARFCGECGHLIPERSSSEPSYVGVASTTPPGYNRLKIHETPDSRDVDLLLSNEAIKDIREVIPLLVDKRPSSRFTRSMDNQAQQADLVEVTSEVQSTQPQLPAKSTYSLPEQTEEQGIGAIFIEREEKLVQEILELKAASKKDYIIRLVSLYLYAQARRGEERVPREEVFKILDEANVKDTNCSSYIYGSGIRLDESSKTMRLTSEARGRAQQYIIDIFNPDVPDGWRPDSPGRSSNGRVKKPTKKGGERHRGSDALVGDWISREKTQELGKEFPHSIIGRLSVDDKALFGLYCLDKAGVTTEVQPTQLSKYLQGAFQLAVHPDRIRFKSALSNIPPYVSRREGEGYRITGSGIEYMEKSLVSDK